MSEKPERTIADWVRQAREQLNQQLRANTEEIQKLEQELQKLRGQHEQLSQAVQEQLEVLSKCEPAATAAPGASEPHLENVLGAVQNLITATLPEQVLDLLAEEAQHLGVRAAVFDIRGKAAWGASAHGFGSGLTSKVFRTVAVPLNQENPFRQVYETGGHVEGTAELFKKNKNVLDKLKPESTDAVLLLPIRSVGGVSAIFYADARNEKKELPVNALKILAEFAGAQLDRLMALSGGAPMPAKEEIPVTEAVGVSPDAQEEPPQPVQPGPQEQPVGMAASAGAQASAAVADMTSPVEAPAPKPAGFDISQLSDTDRKVHQDARRFAKLLVSEIELYNKTKVADGRKHKDLYKRLKTDIDRSRQTYEKRFGKTVAKQYDYFHEELVKTLAATDPSILGSEYPGPSA